MPRSEVFSPRMLAAHLVALICVGVAVGLGFWQLEAWRAQRVSEARDLTEATPVPLADVLGPDDPFPAADVGRPVIVQGAWLPEGTVYVEGRVYDDGTDKSDGYWMVTPLTSGSPSDPALPVVLGWVADPSEAPAPPTGLGETVGWAQPGEGTGAIDDDAGDDVLPQLRIADLIQRVDQDLYGAYAVAQDPEAVVPGGGLEQATPEQFPDAGRSTGLRNLLYAVEWWVFGAFAAFIWWRFVRDSRADESADSDRVVSEP